MCKVLNQCSAQSRINNYKFSPHSLPHGWENWEP